MFERGRMHRHTGNKVFKTKPPTEYVRLRDCQVAGFPVFLFHAAGRNKSAKKRIREGMSQTGEETEVPALPNPSLYKKRAGLQCNKKVSQTAMLLGANLGSTHYYR